MKLAAYLKANDLTYREFAETCGFDPAQVNRWATGKRLPSLVAVAKIKAATAGQVTADDFISEASDQVEAA